MKNHPLATIIIGFIAGLALSVVLGDIIVAVNTSAGRISAAWMVSRAEKQIAGGNFYKAVEEYEKALPKISPKNIKLLAKVKNNLALCKFTIADNDKDSKGIEEAVLMFSESLELYKEMRDTESIKQVETNIQEAQYVLNHMPGTDGENFEI